MRELFSQHPHWSEVSKVIDLLHKNNFLAYIAGGAVRDALLGVTAHDFDVATNALPEDLEKLFPNALDIGKQFGIMMLPFENDDGSKGQIEVATFRSDGVYIDGRRPENIEFSTPEGDAERRDFTVNALFYDTDKDQVIDFVDGVVDIKKRIIRAVGNPHKRFTEDKLRLLRAVRFAAQLQFDIETKTRLAVKDLSSELKVVSKERITAELERLIGTRGLVTGFSDLLSTGLFKAIFSKIKFAQDENCWELFLKALGLLTGVGSLDLVLSTMVVLEQHTTKKPAVLNDIFESLILSRASRNRIEHLISAIAHFVEDREDALILLNAEDGPLISEFGFILTSLALFPKDLMAETLTRFLRLADSSGRLPQPFVTGQDLKNLSGVIAGPAFGKALRQTFKKQLRGELKDKKEALAYAQKLIT